MIKDAQRKEAQKKYDQNKNNENEEDEIDEDRIDEDGINEDRIDGDDIDGDDIDEDGIDEDDIDEDDIDIDDDDIDDEMNEEDHISFPVQAADEVLAAYYARVHRVLRRAGGRDKPVTASIPLSVLESHTLQDFVCRCINGLFDMTLMQEAISQNALAADSLRQANECVKQAALVLEVKAGHARLDA
ncbi:hypothetical protein E4U37_002288 [Claviceps purpurea]|nr:hypothetical protein E4U37_002288 [Claviceps purpurea]